MASARSDLHPVQDQGRGGRLRRLGGLLRLLLVAPLDCSVLGCSFAYLCRRGPEDHDQDRSPRPRSRRPPPSPTPIHKPRLPAAVDLFFGRRFRRGMAAASSTSGLRSSSPGMSRPPGATGRRRFGRRPRQRRQPRRRGDRGGRVRLDFRRGLQRLGPARGLLGAGARTPSAPPERP